MVQTKPKVTLIGMEIARQGLDFIYEGPLTECSGCSYKKVCNNLAPGRRYRIVGIRSTHQPCTIHLNGACAVEVTEAPIPALIGADMAILNSKIRFGSGCPALRCKNHGLCQPEGVYEGEKYIVTEIIGNLPGECEKGRALKHVSLRAG